MVTLIILAIIIAVIICCAFYVVGDDSFDGLLPLVMLLFALFTCGFAIGQETNPNITTSNIKTYTYECQICEETTTQTEEPKIMICDDCKEIIKNIEREDKE